MGGGESTLREVEETSFLRNTLRSLSHRDDSESESEDEPTDYKSIYEERAEIDRARLESTKLDIERFKALLEFKKLISELGPSSNTDEKSIQT